MNKNTKDDCTILAICLVVFAWWMVITFFGRDVHAFLDDVLPREDVPVQIVKPKTHRE